MRKLVVNMTWAYVLSLVKKGMVDADELRTPVMYADAIMKAHENGEKSITFTFAEDGKVEFSDGN
jgi:hypothetical protein